MLGDCQNYLSQGCEKYKFFTCNFSYCFVLYAAQPRHCEANNIITVGLKNFPPNTTYEMHHTTGLYFPYL